MGLILPQLLARAAADDPAREAVRCAGDSLTYGEVDRRANAVAEALIEAGVRPGDRVGIQLPKRVELLTAVYGAMRAGAAYVPLDPKAPAARAALVAADCEIAALVSTPTLAASLFGELGDRLPKLVVLVGEGEWPALPCPSVDLEEITARESGEPDVTIADDDLAYILYTSGSTGVPKGVMLSHSNAMAFVEWSADVIGSSPDDRFSNHAPLHFDLSVFDLYVAAHGGATVVLVPDDQAYFGSSLAALVKDEAITVWYSVPSALALLVRSLNEPRELPSLRAVVFAGEVYPTRRLRELRDLLPDPPLWNLYGPTETNVCTYYRVDELPDDDGTIPIGRACEGTETVVLTDRGTQASTGEEGELYVCGPTVMRGYWGRPDKTAEVLGPHPLDPSRLAYRTGDLVRLRPDGDLEFLGRRDHQIKSRGYRIELGDVEAALSSLPTLEEVVAVALPHEDWGAEIVAVVAPKAGELVSELDVKRHAAERLPRYMVPSDVLVVDALPRTSNGKVDRRRVADEVLDRRGGVR